MATIPGATAQHCVITDECRSGRGDEGAFEEAVRRLKAEYDRCCQGWQVGRGAQIHLALTVERPETNAQAGWLPCRLPRDGRASWQLFLCTDCCWLFHEPTEHDCASTRRANVESLLDATNAPAFSEEQVQRIMRKVREG